MATIRYVLGDRRTFFGQFPKQCSARALSHCSLYFALCQRQSEVSFEQRSLCRSHLCCRFGAGGGERLILLKLTLCDPSSLSSRLQDFLCQGHKVLHLFDLVVRDFNLDGDPIFCLGKMEFRFGEHCMRFADLRFAASTVKKLVFEKDSKCTEVVQQEWDPALLAIASESAEIGDEGIFRRPQFRFCFLDRLLGNSYLRTLLASDPEALLARGDRYRGSGEVFAYLEFRVQRQAQ